MKQNIWYAITGAIAGAVLVGGISLYNSGNETLAKVGEKDEKLLVQVNG